MLFLGILLLTLGASTAIDLRGCQPSEPVVIQGFQQLMGEVTSPGYLENQNYPDNLFCEYRIIAPYGFRIKLTIIDMDIEVADFCGRDAVQVLDNVERYQWTFCGNQTYPPIVTSSNMVIIMFRSDYMVGKRGFRIRYAISGSPSVCNHLGTIPCRNRNCYSYMNACDGKDDCGDGTDEQNCGWPLPVVPCGTRKASNGTSGVPGYDRVVGGQEAEPGSWPWQADLQVSNMFPNGHSCGGTLINPQWVVTAAHCFGQLKGAHMWRIHLGKHNKFSRDRSEQIRYPERIIVYPGITGDDLYRMRNVDMTNDLALIKLNAPVAINDNVRPACLPSQGSELPVGTTCMASGWGMTRGTGAYHALKEVGLTIQPPEKCDSIMMGPFNNATMICVRSSKGYHDVCHGDSGGPLVCETNGRWQVMGATSYGSDGNFLGGICALSTTVYAKVSHKSNWIHQQINMYT